MNPTTFKTMEQLERGIEHIRQAPQDEGKVVMIVRRPEVDQREVLETGELTCEEGLAGDNWLTRRAPEEAMVDVQLTLMNVRVISLLSDDPETWPLAGDQFLVDMDLSGENLPPGTRLEMGSAVIEVTAIPHTGCKKFAARFGVDAVKFVNHGMGKTLHMRGINAKVVAPGKVSAGDIIRKV